MTLKQMRTLVELQEKYIRYLFAAGKDNEAGLLAQIQATLKERIRQWEAHGNVAATRF